MSSPEPDPQTDQGEFWVRWTPVNAARWPQLLEQVGRLDAGERPAAEGAVQWLREHSLVVPRQSMTCLHVLDTEVMGFYSLANSEIELTVKHRNELGVHRRTQPAVLLTWMAKARHERADGARLLAHALARATLVAEISAATVFALDPYDEGTAKMWQHTHGFRESATVAHSGLPRLWIPLDAD